MGFYSEKILPRFLDWGMSQPAFAKYRSKILSGVQGDNILEIGFGSGLNLPYYPSHIQRISTVDVSEGMNALAEKRIQASPIKVQNFVLNGEHLPFENESYDSVVSTWTLCSIADVNQALKEVYRVLKPGGHFYFVEHGLSNEPNVQKWQHRLTPLQKKLMGGCHLNRNIQNLIEEANFKPVEVKQSYISGVSKSLGYFYRGVMIK